MEKNTLQTPNITDTTYNVASDATPSIDPLSSNHDYGHTEFTSTSTVGAIPGASHPVYKAGKVYNDVIKFFERPNVLFQGSIPNATYGLINGNSTYSFIASNINASYVGNLSGSIGIRFTLCLKLEVSATPQAAGIFKIGVVPFGSDPVLDAATTLPTAYATMPSAEINLADTSSVVLKYPFNWDSDYLLIQSNSKYCDIGVVAYTPFAADLSAGLSSSYTVYQWFEDVELIGPGVPFVSAVNPQMGQQEFTVAGPVSKVMSYATKIAGAVGSAIPPLSVYTRPLGWVFSGIGTLASHFGWSYPNNSTMTIMAPTVGNGINCITGVDTANELGMYANNEVKCEPYFASKDFDEMSICYLTCIPCPIATVELNGATDGYGTGKWVCSVSPSYFYYQGRGNYIQGNVPGNTGDAFLPTTIMGVAQFFSGWRGDLIFRFKFARSKFMGGKVLIGYNPLPNTPTGQAPAFTRRYDYQSQVVDLRTTTVADLEVPFSYITDFCPTNFSRDITGNYTAYNTGSVFMYIIEPLVSSGQTATTCYVQVEVFSKCGLQFANVIPTNLAVVPKNAPLFAQMGAPDDSGVLERTCGEAIMSVKQLAMRPSWKAVVGPTLNYDDNDWSVPNLAVNSGTSPAIYWSAFSDNLNILSTWYRFWRGSVIHRLVPADSTTSSRFIWGDLTGSYSNAPLAIETRKINSVRRPFYNYHDRALMSHFAGSAPIDIRQFSLNIAGTNNNGFFARTAGDDFQFGCFVNIPPMASVVQNIGSFVP